MKPHPDFLGQWNRCLLHVSSLLMMQGCHGVSVRIRRVDVYLNRDVEC